MLLTLNAFSLYPHNKDIMVWGIEPRGCFKISSIFRLEDKGNDPLWVKTLAKGLIPKINIFFCTMLQNKILTLDNLQKRGVYLVSSCCLCRMESEDKNQLFLNCRFNQKVWSYVLLY